MEIYMLCWAGWEGGSCQHGCDINNLNSPQSYLFQLLQEDPISHELDLGSQSDVAFVTNLIRYLPEVRKREMHTWLDLDWQASIRKWTTDGHGETTRSSNHALVKNNSRLIAAQEVDAPVPQTTLPCWTTHAPANHYGNFQTHPYIHVHHSGPEYK